MKTISPCNPDALVLVIKGIGPVPAKKNSKLLFRDKRTGRPQLRTKPEYQEWSKKCVRLIAYQLCFATRTSVEETLMGRLPQSQIALLPPDDCWTQMDYGCITAALVPKGQEGAVIVIERNPKPNW